MSTSSHLLFLFSRFLILGLSSKKLVGFDIGGGTPSMATSQQIGRLMDGVIDSFDLDASAEIS